LPPIIKGNMRTLMRKDLVRTAALYSRLAMTNTLRMAIVLLGGARNADEDVLQRRSDQFEMANRSPGHQFGKSFLRIGCRRTPQFLKAPKIRHVRHSRNASKVHQSAIQTDPNGIAAI